MSGHRITLLASQNLQLQEWLKGDPDGRERGAILLFRKFDRTVENQSPSIRFVLVDIIEMSGDWVMESTRTSLRINMRKLTDLYFRCEQEGLELGFAHSHPSGHLEFSAKDDANERNILRGLVGSNGAHSMLVAMVLCDGNWIARVRRGEKPLAPEPVRHVSSLGEHLVLYGVSGDVRPTEILKRQEAAFGKPFNKKLQSLRVVVIGAGGTGSSAATLLARAGVGELIIVDGDNLEETNLNRVRGHRKKDLGENKAKVLAEFIHSLGLKVSVSWIGEFLDNSPKAIDALATADVVFGCTDDIAGRDILNQALYYYALAYIDTGLTGRIDTDASGEPYLRDHRGRVSCILPESGSCLRCQRVVTDMKLKYEQAIEERPELAELDAETLEREYYLVGGGEQAPGVGPFTSATADAAVATLMDLIKPFRTLPPDLRRDNIWQDFVHGTIHSNEPLDDPECIFCRQHIVLLKDEGRYRLEMPALGALR
ncbi:molybdopterin/thiamine biosynthesis adenylyltransferase [Bradyrhizobium niftali]|uniref:HesA/MoeB/ThiF family protein n=1 Tax=Bradyrhizobium niftali TaxID=2560055 RepID=UPI00383424DE